MNQEILKIVKNDELLKKAMKMEEVFWLNKNKNEFYKTNDNTLKKSLINDAEKRWQRFASYIKIAFPETENSNGIIESPLLNIRNMQKALEEKFKINIEGSLYMKMDSHLPISGSIKARGGIYEVLKYAESLALENGFFKKTDSYNILATSKLKEFFSTYTIQVGSTGNLGLSIGIISAKLGFKVIVHMSNDAKQWKKDLLRSKGVEVIEYKNDYCEAVNKGRNESDKDPLSYFVDDENSQDLFLGYSVAGQRLKNQLVDLSIQVDETHPLFVYLPCGIGGAPGGVAYGLKQSFGDNVHCFFTEPTNACCMLMGMTTGLHDKVSVTDFGITGITEADGLAVNRPSAFVGKLMEPHLSGIATIKDYKLYILMDLLLKSEKIFIEPSACASFAGILQNNVLDEYIKNNHINSKNITHILWSTGGNMVPDNMREEYIKKAEISRLD
ncbi:MAG: D-serine ammonia-lyase [Lachnospirales bacterium]